MCHRNLGLDVSEESFFSPPFKESPLWLVEREDLAHLNGLFIGRRYLEMSSQSKIYLDFRRDLQVDWSLWLVLWRCKKRCCNVIGFWENRLYFCCKNGQVLVSEKYTVEKRVAFYPVYVESFDLCREEGRRRTFDTEYSIQNTGWKMRESKGRKEIETATQAKTWFSELQCKLDDWWKDFWMREAKGSNCPSAWVKEGKT